MTTKLWLGLCGGLATAFALGCQPAAAPTPGPQAAADAEDHGADHPGHDGHDGDDHAHAAGPHGGVVTDWGGGAYHVEFTVDHGRQEAVVYLLGDDEKTPAPIAAASIRLLLDEPMTELELKARPLEGEAEGSSSCFAGTHETLGIVREFSGEISGEVDGTPYFGRFREEPHGADHAH